MIWPKVSALLPAGFFQGEGVLFTSRKNPSLRREQALENFLGQDERRLALLLVHGMIRKEEGVLMLSDTYLRFFEEVPECCKDFGPSPAGILGKWCIFAPMETEKHPFQPFLPEHARMLFLGSFPPQPKRWSMPFYYPNWNNDFWRVLGLIFYADKDWFAVKGAKRFDQQRIETFCREQGIALYDTACEVRRLKDNASDKFLEVVQSTDLPKLLAQIPECQAIITTGQKATDVIFGTFGCEVPPMGGCVRISIETPDQVGGDVLPGPASRVIPGPARVSRALRFYRMPSTSRAYPLALEKKADFYRRLFQ